MTRSDRAILAAAGPFHVRVDGSSIVVVPAHPTPSRIATMDFECEKTPETIATAIRLLLARVSR